jgi:hypothetical protein
MSDLVVKFGCAKAVSALAGLAWLTGCLNLWGHMHQLGLPPAASLAVFGL